MSRYRRLLPFGVGIVAAGVGSTQYASATAVVLGLIGYFLIKIGQSTVWTVTGDSRS